MVKGYQKDPTGGNMLEYVSILDFFKMGELGGIKLGMTMEAVEEVLGEPTFYKEGTSISFYAIESRLVYINIVHTNSPWDYPERIAALDQISTKMMIDWDHVSGLMNDHFASQIIEMNLVENFDVNDLGWVYDPSDIENLKIIGNRSEFGYELDFNSGVTINTHQKDYYYVNVELGKRPEGIEAWKFRTYWDMKTIFKINWFESI